MTNDINAYIRQLRWNDSLAVATTIERAQAGFGAMAYCFDSLESFHEYPLSILMRKDFPFANKLNEFIWQVYSNGLLSMWTKQYQIGVIETDEEEFEQVSAETLFFLLIFYFTMSFALVLFLAAERLIYKNVRRENSAKIWRLLEMATDPYRYFLLHDLSYLESNI